MEAGLGLVLLTSLPPMSQSNTEVSGSIAGASGTSKAAPPAASAAGQSVNKR